MTDKTEFSVYDYPLARFRVRREDFDGFSFLKADHVIDKPDMSHLAILKSCDEMLAMATLTVENPERIMLYGLEVHEEFRRQGVCGEILKGVFDFAKTVRDPALGDVNVVVECYMKPSRSTVEGHLLDLASATDNVGYKFD